MTRRRPRAGGSALELALVLPVLITLVLGCVDFGRFSHTNITVTNAARAGAEVGSMNPYTQATADLWYAQIRAAVTAEMAKLERFDANKLTITVTPVTDGDHVRVEVDVSYPFETAVEWPGLPRQLTLRRVAVMPLTRR